MVLTPAPLTKTLEKTNYVGPSLVRDSNIEQIKPAMHNRLFYDITFVNLNTISTYKHKKASLSLS